MRKTLIFTSLMLVIILTFGQSIAQQDTPIFRLGVLDTPNGAITKGAALAVREINQSGGLEGADGTRFRLELIVEYPEADETLNEAIQRLSIAQVIAVLGPQITEDVLSTLPQLQALNVPVLTPATGDTLIATDSSGNLFRIRAAERLEGSALASLLVNDLNINRITTVQLDRNSTGARVGFSTAFEDLSASPDETTFLLDGELQDLVAEILSVQPPVLIAFGEPEFTAEFLTALRDAGWVGAFAYPGADDPAFRANLPLEQQLGVIGTTTWPVTAVDQASTEFMTRFVRTFGEVPGAIEAATYDAVYLIAYALGEPGNLRDNLNAIRNVTGVQGLLNGQGFPPRELSQSVAVIQLNDLGGPETVARYAGTVRLPADDPAQVSGTAQPSATPLPEGVVITIESARQNVRTGPGLEYDTLGQVLQGEQFQVIGATVDFTWVVISYRGQNGWLSVSIADIFGDRSTVPVIAPPPTPTPPPATSTPLAPAIPDIVIVSASPPTITRGTVTNVTVTVANQGGVNAGSFAIAATFPPDNYYGSISVPGLPAGSQQSFNIPITLNGATGNFAVTIVADLNNQVEEGAGEANNNVFTYVYKVDRQLILLNNATISATGQVDLEGNVSPIYDLTYTTTGLNTVGACSATTDCIGIISPALNFDSAHYDAISSANGVNQVSLSNASLVPGTVLGVLTAEGRRAVVRVDAINPGVSITLTWRVYTN